jgi:hypothetical protein
MTDSRPDTQRRQRLVLAPVGHSGSGGVGGAELVVQRADGGGAADWGEGGELERKPPKG